MTETPAPKAPRRRGLRLALILSVAVNLLLIGLLVGGAMRVARMTDGATGRPDLRALWRAMPAEVRETLREATRNADHPSFAGRPDRETRRARTAVMNAALIEALRAEAFDPEAFATLLSGDRDEAARRLDAAHRSLADQIAALPHAQREALAQRFESNLRRPRDR